MDLGFLFSRALRLSGTMLLAAERL